MVEDPTRKTWSDRRQFRRHVAKAGRIVSLRDLAGHAATHIDAPPVVEPAMERFEKTGETIPTVQGFRFEAIDDARVSCFMTRSLVCIDPEAPALDAVRLMQKYAIHRISVRRETGPLQGVLTTMDILR